MSEGFGFYYNQTRCTGCKTCQVACKDKNKLRVGVVLREVRTYEVGEYPNVRVYHYSASCNHCERPLCFANCPVGAREKRDDGTVVQDPAQCIGCRSCVVSCPYGVPRFDADEAVSRKCDGCIELRRAGYAPACVEACPLRAMDAGPIDELRAKYGDACVTELPAMEREGAVATGPHTIVSPRQCATEQLGFRMIV